MSSNQVSLKTFRKLQQIPTVHYAIEKSSSLYKSVKTFNVLTLYGFLMLEKTVHLALIAVMPVVQKLEGPIGFLDSYACTAVDKLQDNVPIITITPAEAFNSTSQVILENGLVQKSLDVVDKTLFLAEKAVTILPNVQIDRVSDLQGTAEEKNQAMAVIESIQNFYKLATTPLSVMGQFLHQGRKNVKTLQVVSDKVTRKRSSKREEQVYSPGFIERLLFLPVQGLHNIGQYAQICSELKMLEDPDIDVNDKLKYKDMQDTENREIEELNFSNSEVETDSENEEIIEKPKELIHENNKSNGTNVSKNNIKSSNNTTKLKLNNAKDSGIKKANASSKKTTSPTNASIVNGAKHLSQRTNPSSNSKNITTIRNPISPSTKNTTGSNKTKTSNSSPSKNTLLSKEYTQGTTKVSNKDKNLNKNSSSQEKDVQKKSDKNKSNLSTSLATKSSKQKSVDSDVKSQKSMLALKNQKNSLNLQEDDKLKSSSNAGNMNKKVNYRRSVSALNETVKEGNSSNTSGKSKVNSSDLKKRRSFT